MSVILNIFVAFEVFSRHEFYWLDVQILLAAASCAKH
jgi:hypothetical protein